jgi:general secretion pathway protein G
MQAKRGFTLVEILIVVVILGILAAIVIPQFTQASTEAKQNSLCSDLQTLRSQIELYKVQHNDIPPTNGAGNLGFGVVMTTCTDNLGVSTGNKTKDLTSTPKKDLGPYLERLPENPFTSGTTVVDFNASTATSGDGWEYNAVTGEIRAALDGTAQASAHQAL